MDTIHDEIRDAQIELLNPTEAGFRVYLRDYEGISAGPEDLPGLRKLHWDDYVESLHVARVAAREGLNI